jgi:mRNA-degrading endonuclease RelE of RelBE toxin-antitoxin system
VTDEQYRLRIARPAARSLAEVLPARVAAAAYAFISGPLLSNPQRVGKRLHPPLDPTWSARRGDYRVLYLIDDDARTVTVTAVRHPGVLGQVLGFALVGPGDKPECSRVPDSDQRCDVRPTVGADG